MDMLTPVLSDAWDTERPWTLESYEQADTSRAEAETKQEKGK